MVYAKSLLVAAALTATVSVNAAGHHGGRPSHHPNHGPGRQGPQFRAAPHRQGGPPHRQVQRIAREELVELDDRSLDHMPIIDHGPVVFPPGYHTRFPREVDEVELEAREPMIPKPPATIWDGEHWPVQNNHDHHALSPQSQPGRYYMIARDMEGDIEARGRKKFGKNRHGKKRPHGHGHGRPKQQRPHPPRPHKRPQGMPHKNGPKGPQAPKMPQAPPPPTPMTPNPGMGSPQDPESIGSPSPAGGAPPMQSGAPGSSGGASPPAPQPSQDLKARFVDYVDENDIQVRAVNKPRGPQGHGKKRPHPHGRPNPHRPIPPHPHMPKGPYGPSEPGAPASGPQALQARIVVPPWYFQEGGRPIGGPYRRPKAPVQFRRDYELDELD